MRCASLLVASALLTALSAFADTVYLKDGRKLEGTITEKGDQLLVKTKFGTIYVKKSDVDRTDIPPTAEYDTRAAATPAGDAEAQFQLGAWCKDHNLADKARVHFEKAIAASPEHAGAHAALGHSKLGNRWGKPDEIMVSVEALLKMTKAARARALLDPLMNAGLEAIEPDLKLRIWTARMKLELMEGRKKEAGLAANTRAELTPASRSVAAKTFAEIVEFSWDCRFDVKPDEIASALPSSADSGPEPLAAGRQGLWDDRVALLAMRRRALEDIAKGKKAMEQGEDVVGTDSAKALRLYKTAEDFFDHANDIVTDFGRGHQLEAVRRQVPILCVVASAAIDDCNRANPLKRSYEMKMNNAGKPKFTPQGLADFEEDRRTWNVHCGKISDCFQQIEGLQKRFPTEFGERAKEFAIIGRYYKEAIPEIRDFFDRCARELK